MKILTIRIAVALFCFATGLAKVIIPNVFTDNMVLQQNTKVKVWGWTTAPTENITVTGSWDNAPITIKANRGVWSLEVSTPKGSYQAYTLTIQGHEKITLKNVLIGEVWLCSGQSNMEWGASSGLVDKDKEIREANYAYIRFFKVDKGVSGTPQDFFSSDGWVACTPDTMPLFSAVGYFFAREVQKNINVPIGLIGAYWGGTPVETWIPKDRVDGPAQEGAKLIPSNPYWPGEIAAAYNVMIHPLKNFAIAGCLWYQGESNTANAQYYYTTFPLLISSWREFWGKALPFYFVQIAPYQYSKVETENTKAAIVRDAQLHTMLTVPNTGMVVTNDIGNIADIHPTNKQEVGHRLALWALAKTYNKEGLEYSGPLYQSKEIKENKVIIQFSHAQGLNSKGGSPKTFEVSGKDGVYHPAEARIKNNAIEVFSKKVPKPVDVRFAFSDVALPNLYNEAGLPASAFTTETYK